jgi:hypothetical protein
LHLRLATAAANGCSLGSPGPALGRVQRVSRGPKACTLSLRRPACSATVRPARSAPLSRCWSSIAPK